MWRPYLVVDFVVEGVGGAHPVVGSCFKEKTSLYTLSNLNTRHFVLPSAAHERRSGRAWWAARPVGPWARPPQRCPVDRGRAAPAWRGWQSPGQALVSWRHSTAKLFFPPGFRAKLAGNPCLCGQTLGRMFRDGATDSHRKKII